MAIVGRNSGKFVLRRVREILVLDAYVDSLVPLLDWVNVHVLKSKKQYSHPSMPPLPVARNRSLQSSGSHSSNDILDLFDVGMESATRHRLTVTSWLGRAHVGSLSGKARLVPAST